MNHLMSSYFFNMASHFALLSQIAISIELHASYFNVIILITNL